MTAVFRSAPDSGEGIDALTEMGRAVGRRLRQRIDQLQGALRLQVDRFFEHGDADRVAGLRLTRCG